MTKETKIGLLVGLGVIIFIGILISDHLSVATQQQPADLTRDNLTTPDQTNTSQNTWANEPRQQPLPPPVNDQNQQMAVNGGNTDQATINTDNTGLLNRVGNEFQSDRLHIDTNRDGVTSHTDDHTPVLGNGNNTQTGNTGNTTAQDTWYTVRKGDSLYKIAQKFYHDGNYYHTIFEINKQRNIMRSANDLRPGMRIVIPERNGGTTTTNDTTTDNHETGVTRQTQHAETGSSTATMEYTIKPGDVLGVLAQKFCGTSRAWPKLAAMNKGVITDPDHLVVGTTIKVPKK